MTFLATLGMLIPNGSIATPLPGVAPKEQEAAHGVVSDMALDEGGMLRGQVVDQQGSELAGIPVHLLRDGQAVARTLTDTHGRFAFRGLQGGVYQIEAAASYLTCRVWSHRTAPPMARSAAMIVANDETVRGQAGGFWSNRRRLAFTLIAASMIATAIAVPLALTSGSNSGS